MLRFELLLYALLSLCTLSPNISVRLRAGDTMDVMHETESDVTNGVQMHPRVEGAVAQDDLLPKL